MARYSLCLWCVMIRRDKMKLNFVDATKKNIECRRVDCRHSM